MSLEANEQYAKALKLGQKYVKAAVAAGENPYPAVLDEIEARYSITGRAELGLVNVPMSRIVGTRTAGRTAALAGNFMPLLEPDSEFAVKWIHLCDAHLGDEGIRDPILCYEFLGKFYVQEGNKRVSVLKSYDAPTIPGNVIRLLPERSDDPEIQLYYEFLQFYALSGLYGVEFTKPGGYAKLQAALGMEEDHVWTEAERRSFSSGFVRFREAYSTMKVQPAPPAEALLVWLQVFPFLSIKELPMAELTDHIATLWPDMKTQSSAEDGIEVQPDLEEKEKSKSLVAKLLGVTKPDFIQVAFIYGFEPQTSAWTRAHDLGRQYLEEQLGDKVLVKTYLAKDRHYDAAIEQAVEEGAKLIFATTPPMIDACRRAATLYKNVKVLNCGLSQPYTGVRMYYSRIYECKFITGAIAGAMAERDEVGFVSGYPIFGEMASINAFALGVRMTNPRARVKLLWSCTRGDATQALIRDGVRVISNRDAGSPTLANFDLDWGTYKLGDDGRLQPLAVPVWNWGAMYVKIVQSVFQGTWDDAPSDKAINYWFGMDSGVIDVRLSDGLPDGVHTMADLLKDGLTRGLIDPFRTRLTDQSGTVRSEGETGLSPDALMHMDWLLNNVDGSIPTFEELLPGSREMVRLLGVYRETLTPVPEEKQL